MRIKKFPITLFFNLAFIIFMVTKIGGNGADSLLKYVLVLLFSIPYAIFYVKMAGGNITLTPEIIPLLGIFLVFENIYIPVLILLTAYITFDALRKIPFPNILRRVFIISASAVIGDLVYSNYRDIIVFQNLSGAFKYLFILTLTVLIMRQISNMTFVVISQKYSRTHFMRDLVSFGILFLASLIFTTGYFYFSQNLQTTGAILFVIIFTLLMMLLQYFTNYLETKKKYGLLLTMMGRIIQKSSLDDQLREIIDAILENYKIHFISIWLTDNDKKVNMLKVCQPEGLLLDDILDLPFGQGVIGRCVDEQKIIYIPDISKEKDYYEGVKGIRSELTIPMIFNEKVVGVIDLESNNKYYFNEFLKELFGELSKQLALIINNTIINDKLQKQSGEVKNVLMNVQELAATVRQSYIQIEEEVNQVNDKLTGFASKNNELNERIGQIAKNEVMIDKNIEKINARIEENADSAEMTNNRFFETMDILKLIFSSVDEAHLRVKELFESLESINMTLAKLTDISERTNILSFNAAIEAARAGELGKGFAVVANNIKELVNKSEKNIYETTTTINSIKELIVSLDNSFKKQSETSDEAETVVGTLKGYVEKMITDSIKENHDFSRQLGTLKSTMGDLSLILSDVTSTTVGIEDVKQKNSEIVNQANFLTDKIAQLEDMVKGLIKIVE
ncbi:GAF domain-containing protein [bacterium]|nr:GAF domain-containing protein [bacterium]